MADDLLTMKIQIDDRDYLKVQRSQKNFQYNLVEIERAYQKNELTAKQYNRQLVIQTKELQKLGFTYNQASSQIRKYAASIRNATDAQLAQAQAVSLSGKGMRRFEILAQQAGYQIGDFAVQVQGGTNIAVAFGQQMSQLLGFFGPTGAIAGAAVAIGTGLIAPLLKAKQEAEDLKGSIEDLRQTEDIIKKLGESIDKNLVGKFDIVRKEFGSLIGDIYKFQAEGIKKAITAGFGGIAGQAVGMAGIAGYGPSTEEMTRRQIQVEDILGGIGGDTSKDIAKSVQDAYDKLSQLPFITEQAKENFRQIALDNGIIADLVDYQEEGFNKQAATAKKLQQIQTDAMALEAEAQQALQEDMVKALSEITTKELDNANFVIEYKRQKQLDADADREAHIAWLAKQERDLAAENAAYEKKADAERAKKLKEHLDTVFNMNTWFIKVRFTDEEKLFSQAVEAKTGKLKPSQSYSELLAMGWSAEDLERIGVNKPKGSKKTDPVADLQKQLTLEKALVGETEARQRVIQALGVTYSENNPKIVEGFVKQIELIKELTDAENQRLQIQQSVESAMEDGWMSMIDGTKSVTEAFKDMARQIILELYRVMIVQRTVKAMTGFFGFADGGVFQGGSQVQAFANGGVVGSPTYFPMSGGKTGLMGEAGPEAIMPLKRGKNGKLGVSVEGGSGDTITVNQTINVSTGVQQTVRTEIKSLMPQIAESAKAAVADAKRRGGSYGKAF